MIFGFKDLMHQISTRKLNAFTVKQPFFTGCFYGIKKGEKGIGSVEVNAEI